MSENDTQNPSAPNDAGNGEGGTPAGEAPSTSQTPDTTPKKPESGSQTQGEGGQGERKYAGRYDSVEDLEKGYAELQAEHTRLSQASKQKPETKKPSSNDNEVDVESLVDQRVNEALRPHISKMEEWQMERDLTDYGDLKPAIDKVLEKNPNISRGDAYNLVKDIQGGQQDDENLRTVQEGIKDDANSGATASDASKAATAGQSSTPPSRKSGITPQDVMEMSDADYKKFISSPAGEEYLAKRAAGEI